MAGGYLGNSPSCLGTNPHERHGHHCYPLYPRRTLQQCGAVYHEKHSNEKEKEIGTEHYHDADIVPMFAFAKRN